ncbi:MAG: hypothetical protein J2P28_02850 [Actinobacteria bacterium]|nr:hypothetical protein [Actinomycetota bacterium]
MTDNRPPLDTTPADYGQADVLGTYLENADRWWHQLEPPQNLLAAFDIPTVVDALTFYCRRFEHRALIILEPQDVAILWGLIGDRIASETLEASDADQLLDLRNRLIDALLGPPKEQGHQG